MARQWCGHTGWFRPEYRERWEAGRIPPGTLFRTKHELAAGLVEAVQAEHSLRTRWVVDDEGDGDDPALLDRFAATGLWSLAEVPRDTHGWPRVEPDGRTPCPYPQRWVPPQKPARMGPVPQRERLHSESPLKEPVDQYAAPIPSDRWQRYRVLEGSKGPLVADFAAVRAIAVRDKLPGPEVWVLFRRTVEGPTEEPALKVYLSNAPAATPLDELVRVSGMRWPIAACFAEGNGELGLGHDALRVWRGWHHHMTLVILAHPFRVRPQHRLNTREGPSRSRMWPRSSSCL